MGESVFVREAWALLPIALVDFTVHDRDFRTRDRAGIMAELVRVAALTGYFEVARRVGLDPVPLLRAIGLTPAMLANPEQMIPARSAIRLLDASAEESGCATFGLRMAGCRSLADLGMVSLLIAHQPTLRDALVVLGRFRHRINSTLVLNIEEHEGTVVLREDLTLNPPLLSRQASDLALGVLARACAFVLGPQWRPECACFDYAEPGPADLDVYRRLFRCRLAFDCEFNGIVLNAADMDRPNPRADPALAMHADALIGTVMEPAARTLVQEVEQSILLLLPTGRVSIKASASALGMNLRTLQRALEAEGTTFSRILARIRTQLASQHLANPRMRLTDIADLLGYSSLGAFTRWYTQSFGRPPSMARKAASAGSAEPPGGPELGVER
jgi:AraC-like DNA-binding protein